MAAAESAMQGAAVGAAVACSGYGDGPRYWNERYAKAVCDHDWIASWRNIEPLLTPILGHDGLKNSRILHVGCGNSILAEDMHASGYRQITSIDNSDVVIEQKRHRSRGLEHEGDLRWICMDATELDFPNECFDVVLEKGLVDTLSCSEENQLQVATYLKEVCRVLVPGGLFFCISLSRDRWRWIEAAPWKFRITEKIPLRSPSQVYICWKTQSTEALLAEWPLLQLCLQRGVTQQELADLDADGEWSPVDGAQVDDVVLVIQPVVLLEESPVPVTLHVGLRGIVRLVDGDGDSVVRFPRLDCASGVDHIVPASLWGSFHVRTSSGRTSGDGTL